jgi:hypothetical protein
MSRLAIVLAALALSLSGCAVYGDEHYRPGYNVQYYESRSSPRVYYYDDDRNSYRWHRDRYQDRRHSHYAPGYDGRYQWHDDRRRNDRHDGYRERDRQRGHGYQPSRQGWEQRYRDHDRREQSSWQRNGGQRYDGYPRDRRQDRQRGHERERGRDHDRERNNNRHSQRGDSTRGWRLAN